jgi:hypothetical protein
VDRVYRRHGLDSDTRLHSPFLSLYAYLDAQTRAQPHSRHDSLDHRGDSMSCHLILPGPPISTTITTFSYRHHIDPSSQKCLGHPRSFPLSPLATGLPRPTKHRTDLPARPGGLVWRSSSIGRFLYQLLLVVHYVHKSRPETPRDDTAPRPWADGGSNVMLNKSGEPSLERQAFENQLLKVNRKLSLDKDASKDENQTSGDKSAILKPLRPDLQRGLSDMVENMNNESLTQRLSSDASYMDLIHKAMQGPKPLPVTESAVTEDDWPHSFAGRASWALELELSMRGVGFTWTTADVRHTRKLSWRRWSRSMLEHLGGGRG